LVLRFWARDLPGIGRNQGVAFAANMAQVQKEQRAFINAQNAASALACVIFTVMKVAN
jgi:hypothetical protein